MPVEPVPETPVTDVFAAASTVTVVTAPVPATPVGVTLDVPVTVTEPIDPVADIPVTDALAAAETVTDPNR